MKHASAQVLAKLSWNLSLPQINMSLEELHIWGHLTNLHIKAKSPSKLKFKQNRHFYTQDKRFLTLKHPKAKKQDYNILKRVKCRWYLELLLVLAQMVGACSRSSASCWAVRALGQSEASTWGSQGPSTVTTISSWRCSHPSWGTDTVKSAKLLRNNSKHRHRQNVTSYHFFDYLNFHQ